MKNRIHRLVAGMLTIAALAFSAPVSAQVVEGWQYCDRCDDARPDFTLSLVAAGTIGDSEIGLPCAPGDRTPFAGHAQFMWGSDGQPGLVENGAGEFVGTGQFALYDPASPCSPTLLNPTLFSLRCQDAQIVATRSIPPVASPNCGVAPFGDRPITAYWNTAVITGVDEVSGLRFEARLVGTRFIVTPSCPLWVATVSVSSGLPNLHQTPPLEPSEEGEVKGKGRGKGKSFGAMKDALRR